MHKLLCIIYLLLTIHLGFGQPYYFNHYQVEDGLSNNAVMATLQDQHGFMWFGTKDGLNRYDGYTFKVFRNNPEDPQSIGRNFVYCLFEDDDEMLWIGTDRGLYIYDPKTEAFKVMNSAPSNEITDIIAVGMHERWFLSRGTIYIFNKLTGSCEAFKQPRRFDATSICLDDQNRVWASSTSGSIELYDREKKSFQSFDVFDTSPKPISRWIEKIYNAGNGKLFIGTADQGIKLFDIETKSYRDLVFPDGNNKGLFVRDFIRYNENETWIGTESGIIIYNAASQKFIQLRKNYNDPYSLTDNAVYTFCKDREGGIWAGTYFGGINYYPHQFTRFKKYFPKDQANSISGNAVREIVADKNGDLLIGTEDAGINKLDISSGLFNQFDIHNKTSNSNIHGLLVVEDKLWIGTFQHGLDVLDLRTGKKIKHYDSRSHHFKTNFIYCLRNTRAGELIAGTNQGIYLYDRKKDDFFPLGNLPETFYTYIFEDNLGKLWIGSSVEGLFMYDPLSGEITNYKYHPNDRNSLADNRVTWIHQDKNKNIWVATESGLCKFEKNSGRFLRYTTRNGLPGNMIFAMLEDKSGNFWVSTSKGLAYLNPLSGKVKIYTRANGLISDQFNYNSAYKDSRGRMYFGTVKGMVSFYPDEFTKNEFLPPVYITGFQLYDQEQQVNEEGSPLQKSVSFSKGITLNYDQSTFSIDFAGLSFTAPEMTRYSYRLAGLDNEWTYLAKNRKVYFTQVPPGKYQFEVKASNNDELWNSRPTILEIRISPPIWLSNYAFALYIVLAGALIWFGLRFYHNRLADKNARKLELLEHEKEREIYHSKIEFFTNLAHEIKTPLTLIKGPMEKLMRNQHADPSILNNLRIMQRNTDRLLDLTTQLLDFRKTETNGFSLNFVRAEIGFILQENILRFKPAAEQKRLQFKIQPFPELQAYIDIEAVNKIISNLLNNALKYADSLIEVVLTEPAENESSFRITISNDGPLIPHDMQEKVFESFFRVNENGRETGTGLGLALARSLAELHNGSLRLVESKNNMNSFELSLPMHQAIEFNLAVSTIKHSI
jgi:ligand-binding sensor domain-containing protein/signal transduction histidine kinase